MTNINEKLRNLPKIDKLLADEYFCELNQQLLKISARNILESIREDVKNGKEVPEYASILSSIKDDYSDIMRGSLYKVINATGVTIHTNLGRSPIDKSALNEAFEIVSGYSNLEYDIAKGKRGDRYHHTSDYLRLLTGAEDAVIVNNNAAAVFIILNTFAKNKEVIVSRGELVEIGGSFRVPDVMNRSGAKLREVGTTNKTRQSDYAEAVSQKTAMVMKVHKSNYEIVGFSEEASLDDVVSVAKENDVISYYDAGSGLFDKILPDSICDDITIPQITARGFDIVSFSGDKMLGGCQAGIIVGSKELIKKIKKNPMMRMLRVDKLTLSLLQTIFRSYIEGIQGTIPVNKMLAESTEALKAKAEKLAKLLPCECSIENIKSTIGGGSCPLSEIDSYGVSPHTGKKAMTAERLLRKAATPVIARIADDKIILDVRTIDESEFSTVAKAVEGIL